MTTLKWNSILILLMILTITKTQDIQITDLNNNNGYITINLGEIKIFKNYVKVLHIINITEFETTKEHIHNNIIKLEDKTELLGPMFMTLKQNLLLLTAKIQNIKPHFKTKRALVNILGTGLKYIAGTMDQEDEVQIKEKLNQLNSENKKLINENNKQVIINKLLTEQITNVTNHINKQQKSIETYLNTYNQKLIGTIQTIETELEIMQYLYQINNDILLLRNHIDDVEQILFSSKLGVLTKNILSPEELDLVPDIENLAEIKLTVVTYQDQIIIILLLPQISDHRFSQIAIEPLSDKENLAVMFKFKNILLDEDDNIFEFPVKDNIKRNLVEISDEYCIHQIFKPRKTIETCNKMKSNTSEIKEITTGIILLKNIKETQIIQNCNKQNIRLKGNYLIKFRNCKLNIKNITYQNFIKSIHDKFVLPNFFIKVSENKTIPQLNIEELYLKHIQNREIIQEIKKNNVTFNITSLTSNIFMILFFCIVISLLIKHKMQNKSKVKISSEPQSDGGGVTHASNKNII